MSDEQMLEKLPGEVRRLLAHLAAQGWSAYLVGGCVRDLLRAETPADYDLTIDAPPEALMAHFGARAHPTGLAHGTVTVVYEGRAFEITTMRCDGAYHDARHPDAVRFTGDIRADLARRDFTINAMALGAAGELIDPFGGREDLRRGVLRCVGEAERRFGEDALRILRLLRFAARFGFSVEEETARAARALREKLRLISMERVFSEWSGLLLGAHVGAVLRGYPDVLGVTMPELLPCVGFDQHSRHHAYDVWEHTLRAVEAAAPVSALRWTMLFHDLGKPACFTVDERGEGHFYGHTARSLDLAREIMPRFRFPRRLRQEVETLLTHFDDTFPPTRVGVHREMLRVGREMTGLLLETRLADNAAKAEETAAAAQQPWREALEVYRALCAEGVPVCAEELALRGEELRALGFSGPEIGAALARLLEEVAAGKLPHEHDALLARAARLRRSGWRPGENKEEDA